MKITEKCKVIVAGSLVAALMTGTALPDRKSTRLNSSHNRESRMPSSA